MLSDWWQYTTNDRFNHSVQEDHVGLKELDQNPWRVHEIYSEHGRDERVPGRSFLALQIGHVLQGSKSSTKTSVPSESEKIRTFPASDGMAKLAETLLRRINSGGFLISICKYPQRSNQYYPTIEGGEDPNFEYE